jgi:hypothetical protein
MIITSITSQNSKKKTPLILNDKTFLNYWVIFTFMYVVDFYVIW